MGTESYVNDDSMVYNPSTGTYSRAGDIRAGSGVLTQQAQDKAVVDQIIASVEAENAAAGGPKTDFTGANYDVTSDSIGGDVVDLGSVFSLFPDAVTGAVSAAMQNDYLNSILETQLTPEEKEAQLLGLSVAQMNAKTEDMLDSILKSQGENETGFVNESARIAAENILKGKIAQAGVTDPAAQEAALKSAMESLEGGASGLEAVKAAAGGAQDYVEELLKTAKDIIDKGYDATIGKLPEILTPEGILADIVTGNVTGVFEIGETGGALPGATSPIFGGTVGTVGGGTNVGIMTTGNAVLDAVIRAAEGGVDAGDIESVVGAVISANTGIPTDVIDAGIGGAKSAIEAAKTVVGSSVTGEDGDDDDDDDDTTDITLTGGTATTRTCDDGSVVGINEACPEDVTTIIGGEETGTDGSTTGATVTLNEDDDEVVCGDNQYKDFTTGQCVDIPCPAGQERDKNGNCYTPGVTDREIIDDDLIAKKDPCVEADYAAANPAKCDPNYDPCDDPVYAAQNPALCGIVVEKDCTDPEYAAANPAKCKTQDPCDDPVYAAQNPAKCGGTVNLCDDPVYAAQNPAKCGIVGGDPCDDPAYAASRPGECGTISSDPCDDPVYAAANPAKCGIVVSPEPPATPTLPTMQGYRAVQTKPGEKVGALDFYDIGGPSIFRSGAKTEEEEDPLAYLYSNYADGGIVQDYDIEELIRFLESQRG